MKKQLIRLFILIFGMGAFICFVSHEPYAADLTSGKATYDKMCAKCHGVTGKGDGKVAVMMKLKLSDYTDKSAMEKFSDEQLIKMVEKGGKALNKNPKMPAYGTKMSADDIKNVIAYIRSFSKS